MGWGGVASPPHENVYVGNQEIIIDKAFAFTNNSSFFKISVFGYRINSVCK